MSKQEIIARMKSATKQMEKDRADETFDQYWAGSASQSYCNAVASGSVRTVKAV